MGWIPEGYDDLFSDETKAFGWLSTLLEDGSPHLVMIWFNIDGEHILINSRRGTVKDHNMRRDARVAFLITDPNNPYRYVLVHGKVVEITTRGAEEHIDVLAKKYTGQDKYTARRPEDVRVIYKIRPERVSGH